MPCLTQPNLTPQQKQNQRSALQRLQQALAAGTVTVVVGKTGGVAFKGWADADRNGVSDLCAYRALANTAELRRAVFRAEAAGGQRVDPRAIATGLHSHDGGQTWSRH
jgi:hypothetical protein